MRRQILSTVLILMLAMTVISAARAEEPGNSSHEGYTLEQVVILSRHNIRSPLSGGGSVLDDLVPHQWFSWTSAAGELSLRGAVLETQMGQYFRLWLEAEGLFPENYRPEGDEVLFYANAKQRTIATARYFSAGLLPVAVVPVETHAEYDTMDDTFNPQLTFISSSYVQDAQKQIEQIGGVAGMAGIRASLADAFELLMDITDLETSEAYKNGAYGDLMEDETVLSLEVGKEPSMSGPIRTATSLADALILQYYEESDDVRAAFGHNLTEDEWRKLGNIVTTYGRMLFGTPLIGVNEAHPMLQQIRAELGNADRRFSFLCGHDSNVNSVLAALCVEDYELPGAIETRTPIGVKLVFERWRDERGKACYDVSLVYRSLPQMREVRALSMEESPLKFPLEFEGMQRNADGFFEEDALIDRIDAAIAAYDALTDEYSDSLRPAA